MKKPDTKSIESQSKKSKDDAVLQQMATDPKPDSTISDSGFLTASRVDCESKGLSKVGTKAGQK